MNEASKTRNIMGSLEKSVLIGQGIDIGCGPDPILPGVRRFDLEDGDANHVTRYVHEQFDFVFSSHCLEHMHDPSEALTEWWQLVKPGGHIYFIVPDEDLYEQGVFPSRFNSDHKATFTISKAQSWSPKSINVLDLARSLPGSELISLTLHDHHYDRSILRHGRLGALAASLRLVQRAINFLERRWHIKLPSPEPLWQSFTLVDQTRRPEVLAQIQCIVRKLPSDL